MSVYIGELHTEVLPAGSGGPPARARGEGSGSGSGGRWAAADRHREDTERAAWLAARTAAEGFDD
ncbi:hypothetical protein ACWEPM_15145 [Streptomyces sp. NPDC004244]|uniref:hypothetical protein n=1 Tax=Streptomyces sp. NPDC101206 TaxID=3366128 RepID=UPI0037F49F4E